MRFVGRRGKPTDIYSDNGTNFVGALTEFRDDIKRWNQSKISDRLLTMDIQWHFNPPAASHRGGVWERIIRSVRPILLCLCREQCLTDEQLNTLLIQAERILNNRPIVPLSSDSNDLEPLTPNSLLLMRCCPAVPGRDGLASRYHAGWKQVNYLAGVFWRRWIREYLPTLQVRTKWLRASQGLKRGDLVLVSGEDLPREKWPLGIVDSCEASPDGLVRTLHVRTAGGVLKRDIRKVCLLEGRD
ncbi:hypothetical protein CLF_108470 [Clonorchis sinensis]|uniref:Integrase catalytic domain-containing protein n=1 Tax=Clonorchis sinensis TaxID=79923 RepID=G7YI41_CLOSI|nr:hypothetical protein CLF_108470 [Clonorchis sinensis]